ncbi:histidine phosphatase superfamily [Staphylotrichum tortipilum]|uniref:Histidine phosphatase superfamily n=1 Tax=Staphylotrichum tortipilum TaxID=2831512 RepID=A0AAN6MKL8_9PEZI|nr:histidine phosphatase superfamily [Staphylotrichum longicolle]
MAAEPPKFKFTAVTGFFEQDHVPANPSSEATTLPDLGLINRTYETDADFDPRREKHQWERFTHYLAHLNRTGRAEGASYKLLYMARHGEGYHNVKEAEVGTEAWESHWAKLTTDGRITWSDARLTPLGTTQALAAHTFWRTTHAPPPALYLVSPLARCLETCRLTFVPSPFPPAAPPFRPKVRELLRERMHVHTCDRRSGRKWIEGAYPGFEVEEGMAEGDPWWRETGRETLGEHVVRVEGFLGGLFDGGEEVVSVTAHSGTVLAVWEALGHEEVKLAPGGVVPVLVRGVRA